VQIERFFSAPLEDERIAPFQPRDDAPFPDLLGEQVADGRLGRLLRPRVPHADDFRIGSRPFQNRGRHLIVVHDDVRELEAFASAHVSRPGSPGPAPMRYTEVLSFTVAILRPRPARA
jgi:hypothetical protein